MKVLTMIAVNVLTLIPLMTLTWTYEFGTQQQIPLADSISPPPPENKHDWVHSVIFEPQKKMHLTRSTYSITTFLDFAPFLDAFAFVQEYLLAFQKDLDNPAYLGRITTQLQRDTISPLTNDSLLHEYLGTSECRAYPYKCTTKLKIDLFKAEVIYIAKVFNSTYHKFLVAIDHIDYHPSTVASENRNETVRKKRSTYFFNTGFYKANNRKLTDSENRFLNAFLEEVAKRNPKLHRSLSRKKRFGLMTWLLGWGVYSNARSISKIKRTLNTFASITELHDKQIKHLAQHLNLTMTKVNDHEEMLYDMDSRLLIMNKTLQDIMIGISLMKYESDLLDHVQARIFRLHTALIALKMDVDSLYEYLRALASHNLNPMIIPPDTLRMILQDIQDDLKAHARLKLSLDPLTDIWSFYGTIKITPIVLEDYLMLILTVPLVDQSLQLDLYRAHNLPTLHPELRIHTTYILEGEYLAIGMNGMYVAIPDSMDIKVCKMTAGHLCMFDKALYPVERINWCIYALFINDKDRINRDCKFQTELRTTNLAHSLDGYLWAISALAAEKIQIRCVTKTYVVDIYPPLFIIDIGNGCEAFSANIYISAKSELTATYQSLLRSQFFLEYNFKYTNISKMLIWFQIRMVPLTEEEIQEFQNRISKLGPMNMELMQKTIRPPKVKDALAIPPGLILAGLLLTGVAGLAVLIFFLVKRKAITSHLSALGLLQQHLPTLIPQSVTTTSTNQGSGATASTAGFSNPNNQELEELQPVLSASTALLTPKEVPSSAPPPQEPSELKSAAAKEPKKKKATPPITYEQFTKATTDLKAQGTNLRGYVKYLDRIMPTK